MKRIYVAGPYSANDVISVLDNMRNGMRMAVEVLLAGYSPFTPWLDYHFQLMLREGETLTVEDYYRYSIAWLEVCDAILVLPDSENSKGTQNEISMAKDLNIPIYHSLKELKEGMKPKEEINYYLETTNGKENQETPKKEEDQER